MVELHREVYFFAPKMNQQITQSEEKQCHSNKRTQTEADEKKKTTTTTSKSVSIVIFVHLFQMEHFSCEKQNFVLRVSVFLFVYFVAIILHTPDFYGQINIRSGSDICEIKSARHGAAWHGIAWLGCDIVLFKAKRVHKQISTYATPDS